MFRYALVVKTSNAAIVINVRTVAAPMVSTSDKVIA